MDMSGVFMTWIGQYLMSWGGWLLAQIPEKPTADPPVSDTDKFIGYLIAIVLLTAVCIGSFKSSKRSHLD